MMWALINTCPLIYPIMVSWYLILPGKWPCVGSLLFTMLTIFVTSDLSCRLPSYDHQLCFFMFSPFLKNFQFINAIPLFPYCWLYLLPWLIDTGIYLKYINLSQQSMQSVTFYGYLQVMKMHWTQTTCKTIYHDYMQFIQWELLMTQSTNIYQCCVRSMWMNMNTSLENSSDARCR